LYTETERGLVTSVAARFAKTSSASSPSSSPNVSPDLLSVLDSQLPPFRLSFLSFRIDPGRINGFVDKGAFPAAQERARLSGTGSVLTEVIVAVDRLSADVAQESAATARHLVASAFLQQRRRASVTFSHVGIGHRLFGLQANLGLVIALDVGADVAVIHVLLPIDSAIETGLLLAVVADKVLSGHGN